MGIKLNTALGGSITLEPTNTANNVTVNLPVLDNGSIVVSNASGNVGIGTNSPARRLDITGTDQSGFIGVKTQNNNANLGIAGIEFSSDSTYTKAAIGLLRQAANGSGRLVFYNDSNNDAANWSDADEKMCIDQAGNIGIGIVNPTAKLHVVGGTTSALIVAGGSGSTIRNTASAGSSWFVGTNADSMILHNESNTSMLFTTNGAERMRISAAGNVGIGISTPATKLELNSLSYSNTKLLTLSGTDPTRYNAYASFGDQTGVDGFGWRFGTTNNNVDYPTLYMVNGAVGIGISTPQASLDVPGTAFINQITGGRTNGAGNFHIDSQGGSCYINFFVGSGLVVGNGTSGGLGAITASAFNVSDRREKENITYFTNGLDKILQLKPATFNFIGKDKVEAGLIAQDVQEVLPEMLGSFRKPDSDVDILSLSNTMLFPYLINAIQELKATVDAQAARIEALENKY
jgi:hypothetical protein